MSGPALSIRPIGAVRGGRTTLDDDNWAAIEADIVLDPDVVDPEATLGLDSFSHAEVVFYFHKVTPGRIQRGARHPRGRQDWPVVGILAQRGSPRPSLIGVTTCEIVGVDGLTVRVRGLDAIDGTPVLDLKPYMAGFAPRGSVREPDWAREIMANYWGPEGTSRS